MVLFSGWIGRKPMAGVSTLAAVDAAIEALGRTRTLELAPRRVSVVTPGMISTPLWGARLNAEQQTGPLRQGRPVTAGRPGRHTTGYGPSGALPAGKRIHVRRSD